MRKALALILFSVWVAAGVRNITLERESPKTVTVKASFRLPTMITFPRRILRVWLGAPSSWIVKVVENELVIRPKEEVPTGIIVELVDGARIPLRAQVVRKSEPDDIVNINYSSDVLVQAPPPPPPAPQPAPSESKAQNSEPQDPLAQYNTAYKWKNSKRIKIKAVLDDGTRTFIVYEKDSRIGAVYLVEKRGKGIFRGGKAEEVLNFIVKENVCKVDRVLREGEYFVVRYGKEKVKIERKK